MRGLEPTENTGSFWEVCSSLGLVPTFGQAGPPHEAGLFRAAAWLAVLFLLVAAAVYFIRRLRAQATEGPDTSSDILTQFREMHACGRLSDEEFRAIKCHLIETMHAEINEDEPTG